MAPSPKPDHHLNLNYLPQLSATQPRSGSSTANTSPIEPPAGTAMRSPFGNPASKSNLNSAAGNSRSGTGSPSHELGGAGRLYSKRAREIQAQEGLNPNLWGPPASGGSTPLRETIPESPSQDGFPDFMPPPENTTQSPARRARAGTVPSRFSPAAPPGLNANQSFIPKTSRPTPSTSPFRSSSNLNNDAGNANTSIGNSTSALLSRLRAGSMPQQASYVDGSNPFGSSLFSTSWSNPRTRSSTLANVRSADLPASPAQSSFSKDGLADTDVKTLDYLGLAETPRQPQLNLVQPGMQGLPIQPLLNDYSSMNKNLNRFRSYSVNAKEKYAAEDEEDYLPNGGYSGQQSGMMTPMDAAIAQTNAQIIHHNLAVQAFASQASANRPRARTAGVLDSPLRSSGGPLRYLARPQQLNNSTLSTDWSEDYEGLPEAVQALNLNQPGRPQNFDTSDDASQDVPTRALWLGNIPTSTTVSSLQAIFAVHGKIESARVLMHKNCGFVNFETVESAIKAKAAFNGKEIFPGAGPVRIGYAKAPASVGGPPGESLHSQSPDPYSNDRNGGKVSEAGEDVNGSRPVNGVHPQSNAATFDVPGLSDAKSNMLQMAHEFGASAEDRYGIEDSIDAAIAFQSFENEIQPISEPSHARIHDAPKLREIRKRIDNNAMSQGEIEDIAIGMLPEIAELASDYLGNTVVQKLFEYCSEPVKEQMLQRIAPHLAEIGVHKNGTWAAQKIIDVTHDPGQKHSIVNYVRPYTVALFLDQYGNYVLQGCLRFGYPFNNFIFETMLSRMWEIAQGRFGARAMRACLESHHATNGQKRMLAAAIVLHSVQLATNTNGALLLTWFLDTCTFPHRRAALAPRLVPHLVHLCTHKVAYLTVLKVINQRNELEARDTVLQALFFSDGDKVLEDILSDQVSGATLIFKVLTTPCFDESQRNDVLQKVRSVLLRLKVSASQGYKRLMDEVGLSAKGSKAEREQTPNGRGLHQERNRTPQHGSRERRNHQVDNNAQYGPQFFQSTPQQQYPMQTGFSGMSSVDPNNVLSYDQLASNFAPNAINPLNQQYQAPLLPRGTSPADYYPSVGMGGYTPPTTMGQLPQQQPIRMSPAPLLQQSAFAPPGFNPMMGQNGMAGGYQYPLQYYPQQRPVMQGQDSGRRGRV
ncbi:hypothetical protein ACLMJK_005057 [Lecanora helva]